MSRSIIRTVTAAIAIAALAAPSAVALPANRSPVRAKGLAAESHKQARIDHLQRYPTRPAQDEQANPRFEPTTTATPSVPPAQHDTDWTTIGLGIAAALLALAAIAGITHHTRSGRARITA
jgi:hypothetical protein